MRPIRTQSMTPTHIWPMLDVKETLGPDTSPTAAVPRTP